jgi:hypothetical protein
MSIGQVTTLPSISEGKIEIDIEADLQRIEKVEQTFSNFLESLQSYEADIDLDAREIQLWEMMEAIRIDKKVTKRLELAWTLRAFGYSQGWQTLKTISQLLSPHLFGWRSSSLGKIKKYET